MCRRRIVGRVVNVRAGAILRCNVTASTPDQEIDTDALGISQESERLYWEAWGMVYAVLKDRDLDPLDPALDAEAAALLEDGWSPGDPVVRR